MTPPSPAAAARRPHTISDIALDTRSIATRSAEVEMERHRAVSDLLQENSFRLTAIGAGEGPYRLALALEEERLVMDVACAATGQRESLRLPLAPLRRHIHDYAIICDNFHKTARAGQFHRLEAMDMGRRALHDEAAELLTGSLEGKVTLDKTTARRLFSLVYVLHVRSVNR